nr:uncharacterized protein LOC113809678 [Penaeus vannamei]
MWAERLLEGGAEKVEGKKPETRPRARGRKGRTEGQALLLNRGRRSPSDAAAGSTAARADEVPTRKTPVAPKTSEDLEGHDAEETPAAHGHPQGHSTARTAPYSRSGRISATLPSAAELLRPVPRKSVRRALRGACTNFDFAKYLDKSVIVKLNGNRVVKGTLRGFDPFMNLVVDDGVESRRSGDLARIGVSVIRGSSIIMVEALDRIS